MAKFMLLLCIAQCRSTVISLSFVTVLTLPLALEFVEI